MFSSRYAVGLLPGCSACTQDTTAAWCFLGNTCKGGKGLSQSELGKAIGTSGDVVGRYERDIINPSIEVIIKTADALEVSIDFLVGKSKMVLDKQTVKRLEDISKLPDDNKSFVLNLIDMALRDFKVKKAHAS